MLSFDLICLGRVAVDFYCEQINSPLNQAQSFKSYLGGCAGNIAVGASRQGLKTALLSCVGQDEMGEFLLSALEKENVATQWIRKTPEHLTGLVILGVNPPENFPLIFYRENCADMQLKPEDCDRELFQKARALLLTGTGLSTVSMRETTKYAIQLAQKNQLSIILDLDYRPVLWGLTAKGEGEKRYIEAEQVTQYYQKILPQCNLIVGTEEEIKIAGGDFNFAESLKNIRNMSDGIIVVKKGEKGCEVYPKELTKFVKGRYFEVKILNVLGAGDAFMSGFLRGFLQGLSWETCATYGNACGALVVTRHGCAPAMPSYEEMHYFIENYDNICEVTSTTVIKKLHRKINLKIESHEPFFILAFDHRVQFEKSLDQTQSKNLIIQFKKALYQGFCAVKENNTYGQLGILIDPIYGETILEEATQKGEKLGVPIEAAGKASLEWLSSESLYQQILKRPKTGWVKVLWQYHPDMNDDLKFHQINKLKELQAVCETLERPLMLELILADGYSHNTENLIQSIRSVYANNCYPNWWKMISTEWEDVSSIIAQNDPDARIIMLGGENKNLESYFPIFQLAKNYSNMGGFAIGRSIFWQTWLDFLSKKININEVSDSIAKKYQYLIELYQGKVNTYV